MPSSLGHSTNREPFEDAQKVMAGIMPRSNEQATFERNFSSVPTATRNAQERTELGNANTIPSSLPPARQRLGTMMGIIPSAEPPPAQTRSPFPSSIFTSVKPTIMFGSADTTNEDTNIPFLPDEDVTTEPNQKPPLLDEDLLVPLPQKGSTSTPSPTMTPSSERNPVAKPNSPPPRARVDLRVVDTAKPPVTPASNKGSQTPPPNPRIRQPESPAIGARSDAVALEIGARLTEVAKKSTVPPPRSVTPRPSQLLAPIPEQKRLASGDPSDENPTHVFRKDEDPNPTHIFERDESDQLPTLHVPLQAVPPRVPAQEPRSVQPIEPPRSGSQVPNRDPLLHGPASPPLGFPKPTTPSIHTSQPSVQPGSVQPKRPTTRPPMSSIPDLERQRREQERQIVETIATCEIDSIYRQAKTIAESPSASMEMLVEVELILRRRLPDIKHEKIKQLVNAAVNIIYGRLLEKKERPQTSGSVATRSPVTEGSGASAIPIAQIPRSSRPPAPVAKETPIVSKATNTEGVVNKTERLVKFALSMACVTISTYLIWLVLNRTQMSNNGILATTALTATSLLMVSIGWYTKKRTLATSAYFHVILVIAICLGVFAYLVTMYLPPKSDPAVPITQTVQIQTPPQKEEPKEETEKSPQKETSKTSAKKSP